MKRILIEKREGFNQEAIALSEQCKALLNIDVNCRLINGYEVTELEGDSLNEAIHHVFSEPMVDQVLDLLEFDSKSMLAREPLPGQYDQRADSAEQCLRLLNMHNSSKIGRASCRERV